MPSFAFRAVRVSVRIGQLGNMAQYILVIDEGTTSTRAMLFGFDGKPAASAQRELIQHYPSAGWVEHDAQEIWDRTLAAVLADVDGWIGVLLDRLETPAAGFAFVLVEGHSAYSSIVPLFSPSIRFRCSQIGTVPLPSKPS